MPETIPYQRFRGKIWQLRQAIQMCDATFTSAAIRAVDCQDKDKTIVAVCTDDDGIYEALKNKYTYLNHKITETTRVVNHVKAEMYKHAYVSLYIYTSDYIKSLLLLLVKKKPLAIIGEDVGSTFTYRDIIYYGSYDNLIEEMVSNVYRKMENARDTQKLLTSVIRRVGISVDASLISEAVMYFQVRHLIVHNAGVYDHKFVSMYKEKLEGIEEGGRISTKYDAVSTAMSAVDALCLQIDQRALAKFPEIARP